MSRTIDDPSRRVLILIMNMCGICGVTKVDGAERIERSTLETMADSAWYRGPDDSGVFASDGVGLAMRRLSIIDLEGGRQPVFNEDRSVALVFNGELYNYRELRARLEPLGHRFRSDSDTEVIVHAYEEWGVDCLDAFRGMFAVALWDCSDQSLLLAVDRFGIKPLYYADVGHALVFGSELVCLLASGLVPKEIDDAALAEYFTFGYIPPPATIFRSARKLEPASYLRWSRMQGLTLGRYWDLPGVSDVDAPSTETVRPHLRAVLRDAVRAHLVSDVPVGAFLSGGIDSSSVVALMSEVSDTPVMTFSIGFASAEHDERHLARLVAERFRTEHHEHVLEPESVDVLPTLAAHFQEPFADSSALPTYYVSKLARASVKVALSGDGGDELFVGYTGFAGVELARLAQRLPSPVRTAMRAVPGRVPRVFGPQWNDRLDRLQKRLGDTALPPEAAYRSKMLMPGLAVVAPLLSADVRRRLAGHDPFHVVDTALGTAGARQPLERVLYSSLRVSLAGDMLVKVDRMSMANSLEVRVPLLDHVVAEYVSSLPLSIRFPRWRLKALLKDTMADVLPREILRQPKHGFTIPLATWFRGDLAQYATDILLSPQARSRGFLDERALRPFLLEHTRGRRNFGSALWSILMFELWCREVLD